ncbi:MAG: superoxide dismutase [Lachnospiraceae bacterium]|nr:superoxide dismutase [Lachnospiraceae bacterium]
MFTQVTLPYATDALEPHIDTLTVETHYGKHHANYAAQFNAAVSKAGLEGKSAEEILSSLDEVSDPADRKALRNNGGGFYNHNLYFSTLSPAPAREPSGKLAEAVARDFASLDALKEEISRLAATQFGSGWAFLSADKSGKLKLSACPNQDNPLMEGEGFVPILALDVWEHAYYLKYKNLRADYIKAFWEVLDWNAVSSLYEKLL